MNKIIISITFIFASANIVAQELPLLSDIEIDKKSKNKSSFYESAKSLETYFSTKDVDKKGSGYKPFKRWEYHWRHYLKKDGSIAPPDHLWKAWEQKQKMSRSTKATSDWSSQGPFSQSSNSGQGRVNAIAEDPNNSNILYVGAPAGGLWKSLNGGVNWTPLTDDLPQIGVSGIAIDKNDSNIIYISTGDDDLGTVANITVLGETDGGQNWNTTGTIAGNPVSSNEIFIDPNNSNIIWVATSNGLFKSINGGSSWDRKQTGHIRDFRLKPGDPNTIYAVSSNTFYSSIDGGDTFESATVGIGLPESNELGRLRVEVTAATGAQNNVYLLTVGRGGSGYPFEGVYKSIDSGLNFSKTSANITFGSSQAWYDLAFTVSQSDEREMFLGVLDVWKSSNEAATFTKINDWRTVNSVFTHADIHFIRYFGNNIYVGSDGGIYKSTNNGASFTDLTENLSISQFYKVTVSKQNSNSIAGGLQDNGGFALNSNTWHNYHGGDGMDAAADPRNEGTFYGFSQFGGGLSVTRNGGQTSNFITGGPTQGNWVTPLVVTKSGDVFAGFDQLYKLIDNSWTKISTHNFGDNIEALEIDPSNNNIIHASVGKTLFISSDAGRTFVTRGAFQTGIDGANVSSIEVHNSNSNIVWLTTTGNSNLFGPSSGHTGGRVYKSTDGGLTYTDISSGLPNESKFVVRHHPFSTNNSIYVGTALGVYHRNDDTDAWEVFSTNLPNVSVPDLEINPYDNTITAATYGRSVWQSPIPAVTLPSNDADLIKINSPNNSITCGFINPKISILNNGLDEITSLVINYNVDNGANEVFNWTGSIASNTSAEIELPLISTSIEGSHTLNTQIVQNEDANLFNNSSSTVFFVNKSGDGQITYTFGDENPTESQNNGEWTVSDNNLWQIGTPTSSQLNGAVPSGYVTNPGGNYPDLTVSYLTSPCYNLSILENPFLRFKMAFDLEQNWDVVYVEYSIDQGSEWQVLGTANDPNWYNSNRTPNTDCFNCPGAQWTGTDTNLKEYSYNLSSLNAESSIVFRFSFISDQSVNEEGVVVDDFVIDASAILSVNDFEEGEFLIYPNPSKEIFNIKRSTAIGENMNIKVYDVTGKLIRSKSNIINEIFELNMKDASSGLYFLEVSIDNKRLVKKLVLN